MQQFECLIPEGNGYKIKQFFSFHHLIFLMWLLIGIAVLTYSDYPKTGTAIVIIALLSIILLFLKPSKTRVYPDVKMFQIDVPRRSKLQDKFSFDQVLGFELQTIEWVRIPLGAYLYMKMIDDKGKERRHFIGSSFGKKKMQKLSNELDEILSDEHQR